MAASSPKSRRAPTSKRSRRWSSRRWTTADVSLDDIEAIAVTRGPGLAGSLLVGVNYAKGLALGRDLPLVGVNHLEGHVYSLWLTERDTPIRFPVMCLIVSGGHSEIVLITGHGEYTQLGSTIDDAAGEAFDKVARLLGLPYPGGPSIERTAREGNPTAYDFPRALRGEGYNFSFSGLKTAVLRAVQPPHEGKRPPKGESLHADQLRPDVNVADVAASFQAAVVDVAGGEDDPRGGCSTPSPRSGSRAG